MSPRQQLSPDNWNWMDLDRQLQVSVSFISWATAVFCSVLSALDAVQTQRQSVVCMETISKSVSKCVCVFIQTTHVSKSVCLAWWPLCTGITDAYCLGLFISARYYSISTGNLCQVEGSGTDWRGSFPSFYPPHSINILPSPFYLCTCVYAVRHPVGTCSLHYIG